MWEKSNVNKRRRITKKKINFKILFLIMIVITTDEGLEILDSN